MVRKKTKKSLLTLVNVTFFLVPGQRDFLRFDSATVVIFKSQVLLKAIVFTKINFDKC